MPEENADVVPMAHKPSVSHVSVTPEVAQRWLTDNSVNRRLRESKINQYANDMLAGRWSLSNDAICFAPDGTLLNGQHRLHAVVKSGVTVVMLIQRNMPREAMATMDSGSARTAADVLGFAGETHAHTLAAIAKLAIICADGRIYKDRKVQAVSHTEIRDFIDAHPAIRRSAVAARRHLADIDAPPTVFGTVHWIIAEAVGEAVADHFLHQLASRTGEPEGSAVLALDSRLRQMRRKQVRASSRALLALLLKGYNHYARDSRVATLSLASNARIPEPIRWQR